MKIHTFFLLNCAIIVILLFKSYDTAKILGFLIVPSISHFIIQDSLMRGLANKGHQVI